jgi:hypothetical protein
MKLEDLDYGAIAARLNQVKDDDNPINYDAERCRQLAINLSGFYKAMTEKDCPVDAIPEMLESTVNGDIKRWLVKKLPADDTPK